MNNTNKNETVYADGTWVRTHQFADGGEILKLSILVDKFSDFIKKHKKADGFINLVIQKKKTPDDKSSHSVKLDNWVPNGQKSAPQQVKSAPKKTTVPVAQDDNDMF